MRLQKGYCQQSFDEPKEEAIFGSERQREKKRGIDEEESEKEK